MVLAHRLHGFIPSGVNSQGLRNAPEHMVKQRALVFLLSDFLFSLSLLEQILEGFHHHWVVPVVFTESMESEGLPRFGIARVVDSETGTSAHAFVAPGSSLRGFVRTIAGIAPDINGVCLACGTRPLFITDRFNAEDVTHYFYS